MHGKCVENCKISGQGALVLIIVINNLLVVFYFIVCYAPYFSCMYALNEYFIKFQSSKEYYNLVWYTSIPGISIMMDDIGSLHKIMIISEYNWQATSTNKSLTQIHKLVNSMGLLSLCNFRSKLNWIAQTLEHTRFSSNHAYILFTYISIHQIQNILLPGTPRATEHTIEQTLVVANTICQHGNFVQNRNLITKSPPVCQPEMWCSIFLNGTIASSE